MNLTETLTSLKITNHSISANSHRGTGVINIKKLIEKNCGNGTFDKWAKAFDPKWDGYLLATAWYSMDMIMFIIEQYKKETGRPFEECAKEIGKFTIQSDLSGVYKMFMTENDPQKLLAMFPIMGSRYHNFLTITPVENSKGNFICDFRLPSIYKKWNIGVVQGRISGILEVCLKQISYYEYSILTLADLDPNYITIQHHFVYN